MNSSNRGPIGRPWLAPKSHNPDLSKHLLSKYFIGAFLQNLSEIFAIQGHEANFGFATFLAI